MAVIDTTELISVSDASKKGLSGLVKDAEEGHEHVVLRNNKPVAAVVGIQRLEQIQELENSFVDLSTAMARLLTTSPKRHSLDEVLDQFGYSREELLELVDRD
jgi:prevent-host-death family protein